MQPFSAAKYRKQKPLYERLLLLVNPVDKTPNQLLGLFEAIQALKGNSQKD